MKNFGANRLPDDLNEWCQQNIDEAKRMFERTVNRNEKIIRGESNQIKHFDLPKTNREKVIQKDDILNLQIMLGQIQSVDDFIKNM